MESQRVFTGKVVSLDLDTVELPNGETVTLEMFRHPGASAVLPFLDDPRGEDPRIVLLRQYRHATGGYLWEIPAGKHEPGSKPEETARRELEEETGYTCSQLIPLMRIWTTPGFTDEVIHLFAASGLTAGEAHRESDEILTLHEVQWSDALAMIAHGEITDAKTVVAILFQDRLLKARREGEKER